ncbi:MAG TPA: hypothetical protein VLZ33_01605 [Dysgonamonadaceae bacterium]|nr:hypothetical protein [Dysgonamonadaceae bacterium]
MNLVWSKLPEEYFVKGTYPPSEGWGGEWFKMIRTRSVIRDEKSMNHRLLITDYFLLPSPKKQKQLNHEKTKQRNNKRTSIKN